MKIRFYLSIIIAKLLYAFLKITKLSSGTAIIGLIVQKICPQFLIYANNYITDSKINITGTNGKTTTTGILAQIIKNSNNSIIYNSFGANMLNGIVNAIALQINLFNKKKFSVLETDEAFLTKVYKNFNSDYLLVTNIFEDQTDRFINPIYTRDIIQQAINLKPNLQLILNADEPISSTLKTSNKDIIYFGLNSIYDESNKYITSSKPVFKCPICDNNLTYNKSFYAQLGDYHCNCGYTRPQAKYLADVRLKNKSISILLNNEEFEIPLTGLYNAYNALGAIVLAKELGLQNIETSIKNYKVAFGRNEKKYIKGHEALIQLIKNPTGTNEILKNIDINSNILIAINNNAADGTDISWIEQVNFEILKDCTKEIVITGLKYKEMATRLKKAGVLNIKEIENTKKAIKYIGENAENNITILTTYTALLTINKMKELKKCY